ncbi:MAG: exopolysaccharide biosynthesis polyprenyl glycosylphosphotransferase [Erysipelotrichaceae bacterium]|nr:exopolysaccharide biosynthesis polyprenyl glycosylphosphotransferase [Erysipelotrichaceae bacterium]
MRIRKIDIVRMVLELSATAILLYFFPFTIERKIKMFLLFVFNQLVCGKYQNTTLLIYDELQQSIKAYAGFLFTAVISVHFRAPDSGMEILLILLFTVIDFICTLIIMRYAHILLYNSCSKKVLVIGAGKTAKKLDLVTLANRFSLMNIKGFVNLNDSEDYPNVHQEIIEQRAPVIPASEMDAFIRDNKIEEVLVAIPEMDPHDLKRLTRRLGELVDCVRFLPNAEETINYASHIVDFDGLLMISTTQGHMSRFDHFLKRSIDIVGGLAGCLILLPLIVYVWFFNRKSGDKDPIFFTQNRIGKNGREFKVLKFRTMVPGAEKILEDLLAKDKVLREEYEVNKKLQNDPRITKAGKFLREKSLDEFPQFINVLKGEMSLIGPRPYLPQEKEDMGSCYNAIVAVRPGVTGMWQTHGRSAVDFERRLELDEWYYRNWSIWLDLTILIKTVQTMILGDDNAV